jgi:RNA polymerase sigma-70 factor (ECF subfamily)
MPESTEAELLARVARGDTDAFGALYDLHAGVLFSLALRILRNRATAEEVLQDVFCQIWEKAGAYDPKLGKPLTWTVTLMRDKAVDRLRSANRRAPLFDPGAVDPDTEAEVTAENFLEATNSVLSHEAGAARAALASLPQDQRQAIEMAFFDGLTQTEIAAALNQPLGRMKASIRRGMLQLHESLEVLL